MSDKPSILFGYKNLAKDQAPTITDAYRDTWQPFRTPRNADQWFGWLERWRPSQDWPTDLQGE